jgi:hypothetical protein
MRAWMMRVIGAGRGKPLDRRYAAWGAGFALLAGLPLLAGYTNIAWEAAELLGLLGTLACVALCACPVRPRESAPPVLLSLERHEFLGWLALAAALLHALLALLSDHTVLSYLLPTAPLYQLAGIAALLGLATLVTTASACARRRIWKSHRNFQATHIAAGCLVAVLLGAHVLTTGRYTGGLGRRLLYVTVAACGLALLLQRRRGAAAGRPEPVLRAMAFGRHSRLVASAIAAAMLCLAALAAHRADLALREPVAARLAALPLNFDHGKHTAVNCLACHHNYADGRGFDACIHCHRGPRADLVVGVEARFHDFCLGCHRNPAPALRRHGPVSGCAVCHRPVANFLRRCHDCAPSALAILEDAP